MINKIPALIEEVEEKLGQRLLQKDIADAIDLPEGTLSRYVNGNINGPKFDIEYRLCRFFSKHLGRIVLRDDLYTFDPLEMQREPA